MQRLATPALVVGLLGLLAGGLLRQYRPSWANVWPAVLIVGGLVFLFGFYASFAGGLRGLWGRRATRYGLNAAVMVLLILGVVVLVEAVSYRHNWRLDLTENRRHSLSAQTTRVLRELRAPVKATGFYQPDQPGKRTAEDLFKQYAARSDGKFSWEIVDADRQPLLAKRYGIESYGTVVLEVTLKDGQVKEEKILDAEEEKLTNGLIRVTREGKRVIYFLKGHGEKDIASTDRTGYSQVKDALTKLNYEVKDLLLAREPKVPDDAAILVVAGPEKDLLDSELTAITGYVGRAGKVLFLVDPFVAPGLSPVLQRYGVTPAGDVIIDDNPQAQLLGTGPGIPIVGDYQSHPITREFRYATLFPLVRSLGVADKAPEGVTVQALARTSPESWPTDEKEFRTGQIKPPTPSVRKAMVIAAVATVDARDVPEDRKGAKSRVVMIGDSDFATNAFVNLSGNRDFFLNTLSWLAEEENLIAIRPRERGTQPVFLTGAQGQVLFWVPIVLVPLAMVVAGGYAVARRRAH